MPGIRIVTDSSCDLPQSLADAQGIAIVPLTIRFGSEELVDRRDLTPAEFWSRCASSAQLPETAAPAPGLFDQAFRAAAADGADGVVCVNISTKLSATGQSAQTAANGVADVIPVKVVDSRSVTLGLGMVVLAASAAAAAGASLDAVVAAAETAAANTKVFGTIDTLDFLKKGGRIGGAQALLGSLLSIKPVIEVRDGAVEPGPKQRTRSRALKYLVDRVAGETTPIARLAVLNGAAPDLDAFLDQLGAQYPRDQIVVGDLGAVIGAHTGPGTIGVAYQVG